MITGSSWKHSALPSCNSTASLPVCYMALTACSRRGSRGGRPSSRSRVGGQGGRGNLYMGGARNSFCVVLLADHGGLATQGPRHRRLARLECINHVHLQRTGERTGGRGQRKKRKRRKTETKGPKGEVRADTFVIWKKKWEHPLIPQIKSSVSTEWVWQEKGWHRKIKRKVLCGEHFIQAKVNAVKMSVKRKGAQRKLALWSTDESELYVGQLFISLCATNHAWQI